jgi:hypothetical protein
MQKIILMLVIAIITGNTINAQCTCGTVPNWNQSFIKIGFVPAKKFKCGYQFSTSCRDTIRFLAGGYTCTTSTPCTKKYKANVYNSAGVIIRTIDPFNFSSSMLVFSRPDTYKLEILAFCNNNSCKPCYYYFTVRNTGCSPA